MLTKGIIIDRVGNDNHYLVRIPILEGASDVEHSIIEATLAYTSGIVESYKPDDVVVVGFENHSPDSPIIVGKLFLQDDVNETLKDFSNAGIKLWVLTGDKKDTAKSIAYSCGLFDDEEFNIFEINEKPDYHYIENVD